MSALNEIIQILSKMSDPEDIEKFFMEILTPNERKDLSLRWELMKKLHEGIPQRVISSELGISLCKITRGSKILKTRDSVIGRLLDSRER